MQNVEIAAVCHIDESILAQRLKETEKATGKRPARFTDLRKVLDDKCGDAPPACGADLPALPRVCIRNPRRNAGQALRAVRVQPVVALRHD